MDVPNNQVEGLLSDESFLAWYFKTDAHAEKVWEERIAVDPAQKKLAEEAIALLQTIRLSEQPVDAHRIKIAEQKLTNTIMQHSGKGVAAKSVTMRSRIVWWAAAAAVVVASIAIWQFRSKPEEAVLATAYGQTRSTTLPDGSVVMLNANSSLNYKKADGKADREVWVTGEAFFQVKKTPEKTRFIVHTGHFDVVVTGTEFNVINRPKRNNVLLKEGSVIVQSKEQEITLAPGDYVEYNQTGIQKKVVSNWPLLSWTEHRFIFESTPLQEVAELITDSYGIKVTLANEAAANATVTGILPNDNLDILMEAMKALPNFEITRTDKEIQIRKN